MSTSIQKLLKKKGWTGEEIGKLLVASYLNDIKKSKGLAKRDLFTQAEFQAMADKLTSSEERQVLVVYDSLSGGIQNAYATSLGMKFAFGDSTKGYNIGLTEIFKTEYAKERFENIPYVVTQAQYDRLVAEATEKYRKYVDTYAGIFFHLLDKCLDAMEAETEDKEAPKAILAAIEKTKTMPAQGSCLYADYSEQILNKEWVFPNGQRLSKDKHEAQRQLLEIRPQLAGYEKAFADKKAEIFFYGADAIRAFLLELTGGNSPYTDEHLETLTSESVDDYGVLDDSRLIGLIAPCLGATLQPKETPQDLSMFDMLTVYAGKMRETDGEKAEQKLLAAFKKEMPELFEAVTSYISEVIPSTKGTKPKDYGKPFFTWGELADAGLYSYDKLVALDDIKFEIAALFTPTEEDEDTTELKQIRGRILWGGLAIAVNPRKKDVDKDGNFIDKPNPFTEYISLDKLEQDEATKQGMRERREEIKIACRVIFAHNALMKIVESVYDIPELYDLTKVDEDELNKEIQSENLLIFHTYAAIYGTQEDKERKRRIFKEIYDPINIKELMPTQEAIEAVRQELIDLGFTKEAKHKLENLGAYVRQLAIGTK